MTKADQHISHLFLVSALLAAAMAASPPAAAQSLALKRVLLSTGGVAYLEHEAEIDGTATLPLSVRLDQIDDVLKSIVVYDGSGRIAGVSLAGRAPLARIFSDLPFDQSALSSPVRLLNALSGAEIEATGARTVRGRILRVTPETHRLPGGQGTVTRHRLALQTATGLQHLIYEDTQSVRFLDPAVRDQIDRALAAVAQHRVRDRRTLEIATEGTGRRTVRVGYVVEAPLWKATYRLTGGAKGRARLQGWAVVENMTGIDWSDVALVLASGNPVTFRQALYEAYYVKRPELPVSVAGRVLPRPDSGAIARPGRGPAAPQRRAERQEAPRAAFAKSGLGGTLSLAPAEMRADAAPPPAAMADTASPDETMSQVLFRFPAPVGLGRGKSALLPIVGRDIPAQTVALFQPERHARHPFAAIELTNDTGTGLPPGVVTHFAADGSGGGQDYVGDAELRALPAGESRLLSFALDNSVKIERKTETSRVLVSAGMAGEGVLRQSYTHRRVTTYRIASRKGDGRDLLIEQRRLPGWTLTPPDRAGLSTLPGHYRLRVALEAGGDTLLTVVEERPAQEMIRIGSLPRDRIVALSNDGRLDAGLRASFARIAELQRALAAAGQEVRRLERDRKEIVADQARLRENLRRVPAKSDLHARYLKRLAQQEDRLEALHGALDKARAAERAGREALGAYIAKL